MSDGPLLLKEHGTGLAQLHRGCRHQLQCFKLQLDMTGQTQSILWDILLLMRYTGKRIRKKALKAKKIKAKIWSLPNRQFYTCVGFFFSRFQTILSDYKKSPTTTELFHTKCFQVYRQDPYITEWQVPLTSWRESTRRDPLILTSTSLQELKFTLH